MRFLCGALALVSLLMASPTLSARRRDPQKPPQRCVDMTRTLHQGMIHFPRLQEFLLNVTTKDIIDVKFQLEVMTTATHMGTHMDAPLHFNENGLSIDKIKIEKFDGVPACVIDVRNKTNENPGYNIEVSDITDWEKTQSTKISNGSLVIFLTGWGERWPDPKKFLGTDQDDPAQLQFPGVGAEAAKWLAERAIVGVGTECVSIDPSGEKTKTAHRTLLNSPHELYILENLANVDRLPAKGAKVRAYPIMIGDGSGAPARVIACFRPRDPTTSSSRRNPPRGSRGRKP